MNALIVKIAMSVTNHMMIIVIEMKRIKYGDFVFQ